MEGGSGRLPIPFWILIMQNVHDVTRWGPPTQLRTGQLTLFLLLKPLSMIELAFEKYPELSNSKCEVDLVAQ